MNYVLSSIDEHKANLTKLFEMDKVYFETSRIVERGEQLIVMEMIDKPSPVPKSTSVKQRATDDCQDTVLPDSQSDITKPGSSEISDDSSKK